ncbi:MAG TPA: chorismate mutase [Thermomonospora sp.]|nr:chorismate mutase [Thermomonospora sp.]
MPVRAIRGAVQVDADDADAILDGTADLVTAVLDRNALTADRIISVIFSVTDDLTAAFPAVAARRLGLTEVPLMCVREIPVPGSLERVVRLLAHAETARPRSAIRHVYLRGAAALRRDLVS